MPLHQSKSAPLWLGEMEFAPSTINQRLAAIRKLATEAERCGYVDSVTAQAIVTVAGVKQKGRRLGRRLALYEFHSWNRRTTALTPL
jgi:hypothetical protein